MEKRKPGRPSLKRGERSVTVTISITEGTRDNLKAIATQYRCPVASIIRDAIDAYFRES
jgi:hypothetical protein